MHSHRIFAGSGGAGEFKSHLTGKAYKYQPTRDGSDRRRALAEMNADDQVMRDATQARAGRPLTDLEILRFKAPDNRTTREKVEAEIVHRTNAPAKDVNHYERRANELREQLANESRRGQRETLKKRLRLAEQASEKFEADLAARREWESKCADPAVATAKTLADSWHVLLRVSRDPACQPLLERCEAALKRLGLTADHETCRAELVEIERAYESAKQQRVSALETQAAEARQAVKQAKAEAGIRPETDGQ